MSRHFQLRISEDGLLARVVSVGAPETWLGRDPDAPVRLDNPRVSKRHCRLVHQGESLLLEDLGSAGGILHRGRRVKRISLAPGDCFSVGPFEIRVEEGDVGTMPAPATPPSRPAGLPRLSVPGAAEPMESLVRLTRGIFGITDLQTVLETLLEQVKLLSGARSGFVVVALGGELSPILARTQTPTECDESFSRTLCKQSMDSRITIMQDIKPAGSAPNPIVSLQNVKAGSVLVVPLVDRDNPLGVIYLESDLPTTAELRARKDLWAVVSEIGGKALRATLDRQQLVKERDRLEWLAAIQAREPELARSWKSPNMQQVVHVLERVSVEDINVLLLGESGTGKEVAARTLHQWSSRWAGPFVALNCGAIPTELVESELFGHEKGAFTGAVARKPGRLELAEGGTLFLDEVGELSRAVQVKLLRVLETRTFERVGGSSTERWNARLLAATNRDLPAAIQRGEFREDLYYRLNVVTVTLPPLRERTEDLVQLALEFLRDCNRKFRSKVFGITPEAVETLTRYSWPGNIRELRNVIERAFVLETSGSITIGSLPSFSAHSADSKSKPDAPGPKSAWVVPLSDFVREQERQYIASVLDEFGGNLTQAAAALKIARSALYKKLYSLGLRTPGGDPPDPE